MVWHIISSFNLKCYILNLLESSKSARENNDEIISRPKLVKQEDVLSMKKSDLESEHILANLIGDDGDNEDSKAILKQQEDGTVPVKIKKCKFVLMFFYHCSFYDPFDLFQTLSKQN